ncbi:MAG: aldehyde dehydrogenase family protein [Acidobacteriota bacterium]|jgi:succinate-semialdehyde dehydrogenase/glutarate-semialdehyde dehydrogenase|nr:aldehyde dehydrogenase family protein [Acidobacteriota bacterium]
MSAVVEIPVKENEIVSYNPANGKEVGRVRNFSKEEVETAVEKSRETFEVWKRTPFAERRRIVMRAREVILQEADSIAKLISDEMGKPIAESHSAEITPVLDLMQFFARNAEKMLKPKKINIGLLGWMGRSSKMIYKPLGVVAIISPWNFPFSIPLGEVVMSLMAGNTIVLKPSELTPLTGEKIAEIFETAGLPKNVLQVVSGDGKTGKALVESAPNKIMFTGSVATGKKIAEAAAKNLTSVVLELGGKDPMIVFADADLEKASSGAVWGAFTNSGQACSSVERLYVEEKVAEKFTQMVVEKARNLTQGMGDNPNVEVGSMSSEDQIKIVEDHVQAFKDSGAEILTGGNRNKNFEGIFFEPTVIKDATNKMRPMREETFGPTLPIATFKGEDEAIQLANDTDFGLTASVWTGDLSKGKRIAEKILAGTVTVNEVLYTHGIGQTPWGGFKDSGYGRTHGQEGLMELVGSQHIHVNRFLFTPDVWWFGYSENAIKTFKEMGRTFASGSLLKTVGLLPQMWSRIKELQKNEKD